MWSYYTYLPLQQTAQYLHQQQVISTILPPFHLLSDAYEDVQHHLLLQHDEQIAMELTRVLRFLRRSKGVEGGYAQEIAYQVQDQFYGQVIRRRARRSCLGEGLGEEGREDREQSRATAAATTAIGRILLLPLPPSHPSPIIFKGIMMTRMLDE